MANLRPVFVHDNLVSHQAQRGVARSFRHITDGIVAHFGKRAVVSSAEARDYGAAKSVRAIPRRFPGSYRLGLNPVLSRLADRAASAAARHCNAGLIYSPYYGELRSHAPEVFTVYDMIHELYPQHFPPEEPGFRTLIAEKRRCLERAAILVTISESTARDIIGLYPQVDPEKIRVVHLGVEAAFFSPHEIKPQGRPYFLYVGDRKRYKNFRRLLIAFGESGLAKSFQLRVISSSRDLEGDETEVADRYGLHSAIDLVGPVADGDLPTQYAQAAAFVCPSEYEGFGLPLIEAMASGTVVISADTSSLPEVGGDVPFYVAPRETSSMAGALHQVARLSPEARAERIVRGIARARTFSWERTQRSYIEILERCIAA